MVKKVLVKMITIRVNSTAINRRLGSTLKKARTNRDVCSQSLRGWSVDKKLQRRDIKGRAIFVKLV